eukprot:997395-Rhodomonas_salina.2
MLHQYCASHSTIRYNSTKHHTARGIGDSRDMLGHTAGEQQSCDRVCVAAYIRQVQMLGRVCVGGTWTLTEECALRRMFSAGRSSCTCTPCATGQYLVCTPCASRQH